MLSKDVSKGFLGAGEGNLSYGARLREHGVASLEGKNVLPRGTPARGVEVGPEKSPGENPRGEGKKNV